MSGHLKNILTLLAATLVLLVLLASMTRVSRTLAPRFRTRLSAKAAQAPMLKEAKRLGLTYDSVLADPVKALGRPAVWCLRQGAGGLAAYDGDPDRTVEIVNPEDMPAVYGSTHQQCADALIELSTVTYYSFGGVSGARLKARFVAYP
jgi:hypothetical protein